MISTMLTSSMVTMMTSTIVAFTVCVVTEVPGPRIPPGACQPIFMFARSLQKRVFCNKFRIHWFDGLPFRISTTYILGSFTNIGYLRERLNKGGKVGIFDLGACEVAQSLQARLAGSHRFFNQEHEPDSQVFT